jgi:hypothetical protein
MYQETADWLHPVETVSPVNWCSYQNNRNFAKIDNPPIDVFSAPPFALPKDNYQVFEGSTTQGFAGLFILRLRCQCPFMVPTLVLLRWDCVVRIARPHPRIIFCSVLRILVISAFLQLAVFSTYCFINLFFHQLVLSACWCMNLLFHQLAVLSYCNFVSLLFFQLDFSSICCFANLPLH